MGTGVVSSNVAAFISSGGAKSLCVCVCVCACVCVCVCACMYVYNMYPIYIYPIYKEIDSGGANSLKVEGPKVIALGYIVCGYIVNVLY
jgi:hypothetical protein